MRFSSRVRFGKVSWYYCMAQWVARLTSNWWLYVSREFELHQRLPWFLLLGNFFTYCLVLVGSRYGFEGDLHKQKLFPNRAKTNKLV